jgi:hypothetical protein
MKIQGGNPFSILGAYLKGSKEVKKGKESVFSAPPPTSDRVEISGKAKEIARLTKIVSKGSDVREEKVSGAIKNLAAGRKFPEARVLAESLVKAAVFDKIL